MRDYISPSEEQDHRARLRDFVECAPFRYTILAIIGFNAVILGLETSPSAMAVAGDTLHWLDTVILWIFVGELALRLYAHGFAFFRDPWAVFDFAIVAVALVPASEQFSVLRALRVLRAMRIVSGVPRLRRVVGALLGAVPGIGAVAGLLSLIFYVFSVIATKLFGGAFSQWFGSIGESMYSLFQIMTLESWSMGIVRPVMEQFPYAWSFFVPFIIISSFTVLNLFIAIIVDSMQTMHREEDEQIVDRIETVVDQDTRLVSSEINLLREEVRALRDALQERKI